MPNFTLFLDESNHAKNNFLCIAGCIINNDDLKTLDNEINNIKTLIWDEDYIKENTPILHASELSSIYKNRGNYIKMQRAKENYRPLASKNSDQICEIYDKVYKSLSVLIKDLKITTICCIIDKNKLEKYYCIPSKQKLLDDWYEIAMQKILESYTHFLCTQEAIGSVIYEARDNNSSLDNKMHNNYCKFKVNGKGAEYLSSKAIFDNIRFFNIISKKDDNPGLQLADFIAFNYLKWFMSNEGSRTEFMKKIHKAAYNGSYDLSHKDCREYFGVRILPHSFFEVQDLRCNLNKIKKAQKNLKRERNRLNDRLEQVIKEKRELNNKYQELLNSYNKCLDN